MLHSSLRITHPIRNESYQPQHMYASAFTYNLQFMDLQLLPTTTNLPFNVNYRCYIHLIK